MLPDLGEGLSKVVLLELHIKEGQHVKEDEIIMTVETAKSAIEIPSPVSGVVDNILFKVGDEIRVGSEVITFNYEKSTKYSASNDSTGEIKDTKVNKNIIRALPAARKLAMKHNISLEDINPKNHGIIKITDVENFIEQNTIKTSEKNTLATALSQATIHDDAVINKWDSTSNITIRLIQAMVKASIDFPKINSYYCSKKNELSQCEDIMLGIAIQTDKDLFSPIIDFDCNYSSESIKIKLNNLKIRAKAKIFQKKDCKNPSMILSNIGTYGVKYSVPLVIKPSIITLACGSVRTMPALSNGELVELRYLPISVSFDHDAITGADAAVFLKYFLDDLSANKSNIDCVNVCT